MGWNSLNKIFRGNKETAMTKPLRPVEDVGEKILQEVGHGRHGDECSNCIQIMEWVEEDRTETHSRIEEVIDGKIRKVEHSEDCIGEYCDESICDISDIIAVNKALEDLKKELNTLFNKN